MEYRFLLLLHRTRKVPFPYGPLANEIVTCDGYHDASHIYLKEYSMAYHGPKPAYADNAFEPVVPEETIKELLEIQPQTQGL